MSGQPTNGAELIAAERNRQIEAEGWTPEHDDEHDDGSLLYAARAYAFVADTQRLAAVDESRAVLGEVLTQSPPPWWPWDASWWKPSDDPTRNLVKAGALIAAEIDRLARSTGGAP